MKNNEVLNRISSIAIVGQMHGVVSVSHDLTVLHDCITWCDTRSKLEAIEFQASLDAKTAHKLRNPSTTAYSASKIAWILKHLPVIEKQIYYFLFCKDYIRALLTDTIATDYSDASGSLLFDFDSNNWSKDACDIIGVAPSKLPPILSSTEIAGVVSPRGSRLFGLKDGIPVAVGSGDLAASLFGSNVKSKDDALINLGTAGQVLLQDNTYGGSPEGGYIFKYINDSTNMFLFSLPSAAYCIKWFIDVCRHEDRSITEIEFQDAINEFNVQAERSIAGANGLLFIPYLSGTGSPYFDDNIRGGWIGLSGSHSYGDMARSIMEGVAFGILDSVSRFTGFTNRRNIHFTGGGARSFLWRQIMSNVLCKNIITNNNHDITALGAAHIAAYAVGVKPSYPKEATEIITPNLSEVDKYAEVYKKYIKAYPAIKSIN